MINNTEEIPESTSNANKSSSKVIESSSNTNESSSNAIEGTSNANESVANDYENISIANEEVSNASKSTPDDAVSTPNASTSPTFAQLDTPTPPTTNASSENAEEDTSATNSGDETSDTSSDTTESTSSAHEDTIDGGDSTRTNFASDTSPPNSARDFSNMRRNTFSFNGFMSVMQDSEFSPDLPPPPEYTPTELTPPQITVQRSPRLIPRRTGSQTLPRASSPRASSSRSSRPVRSSQRIRPMRCKSGYASVGIGECADFEQIKTWKIQFIDIRDNVMHISPTKEDKEKRVTVSLKDKYASLPRKKIIAVHGGPRTLLIKSTSEINAHHWLMALSQYCYVAPTMDGHCEKLCRKRNEFKDRYLRLCSDGILSWYRNESEDVEPQGSIQIRGEASWIDNANPKIVHIQVEPKGYQFRFLSKREAELWLAALKWHYGRKLLRRASVPIRNKAK